MNSPFPRPIPADFADMRALHGGIGKLAEHYGVGTGLTRRWLRESGLPKIAATPPDRSKPIPDDLAEIAPRSTLNDLAGRYDVSETTVQRWLGKIGAKTRGSTFRFVRHPGYTNLAITKTYSDEDRAADVLRPFGMVCRCNERGSPDYRGTFWRFGNVVLTGPELIARAERKAPRGA